MRESINLRLDAALKAEARKQAEKEHMSMTALIVRALRAYLQENS